MNSPRDPAASASARVQSVERAVSLMRAVAVARGAGAKVSSLADECGVNRATAWRLLTTLEAQRLVVCDRRTGQWSIGDGLLELAGVTREKTVLRASHTILTEVAAASGETAAVAIMQPEGLTYIDEVAPTSVVAATWQGRVVPLHATSTGKAWLAAQPDEQPVERLLLPLERFTDTTVVRPDLLGEEVAEIRRTGYGVCRGEFETTAYGVSAVVHDLEERPVAVLSIWGPASRFGAERFAEAGTVVSAGAAQIGERLAAALRSHPA